MAGTKRASDSEPASRATRASKVAKTDADASPKTAKGGKGKKGGAKASLSAAQFKSHALPLHVHLTHTPPAIDAEVSSDPGSLGSLALTPTSFSTGSYGWKGTKRLTVVLNQENENGEKEKVQVMLNINATVLGSKDAPEDSPGDVPVADNELKEENGNDETHADEEANGDA